MTLSCRRGLVCLAALLVVSTAFPALAQQFSTLTGVVKDTSGAVVPQATITLTHAETGVVRSAVSESDGAYRFVQLGPGAYTVRVEKAGFRPVLRTIDLIVATPDAFDPILAPGELSEEVSVTAPDAALNRIDASSGSPITEREIKNLPFLARNPVNLLTLQPGVVFTGASDTDLLSLGSNRRLDDREGATNGVRGNQTNVTIDGADANDFETQAAFSSVLPISLDSLQEFRVTTAGATAAAGVAGGAQVTLVTKNGSNDFRGNLRWYHRPDGTASNSYFNQLAGVDAPALDRHIGGGSLGGPVWRSRMFFFADVEGRRDRSESAETRLVPSDTYRQGVLRYRTTDGRIVSLGPSDIRRLDPAGLGISPAMLRYMEQYPTGNDTSLGDGLNVIGLRFNAPVTTDAGVYTARLDANLTSNGRHGWFIRGTAARIDTDLLPAQFPDFDASSVLLNRSRGFVTGYNSQWGSRFLNTFRYGLTRQAVTTTGVRGDNLDVFAFTPFFPGATAGASIPARESGRQVPVHTFENDTSWFAGRHAIHAGGWVRLARNQRFNDQNAFPRYFMGGSACLNGCREVFDALLADSDPTNDPADFSSVRLNSVTLLGAVTQVNAAFLVDPANSTFLPPRTGIAREYAENGVELFVQDSWQLRADLTLTAGLRYSYYTPIWETDGRMVRPTVDVGQWWDNQRADMLAGRPADAAPLLSYDLAGKPNGQPALWKPDRNNIDPRVSVVWSPQLASGLGRTLFGAPGDSALRAGFGLYRQRIGSTMVLAYEQFSSPGLSARFFSPSRYTLATAPRFAGRCTADGCVDLPPLGAYLDIPTRAAFPFQPAANASSFHFLIDDNLETPYSRNVTLSWQRRLGAATTVDVAYVGIAGRKQLLKMDLAQSHGLLTDPQSRETFYDAFNRVIDLMGSDPSRPAISPTDSAALARIPPIAFVQNLLPHLPAFIGRPELTPTQAFYVLAAQNAPSWGNVAAALDAAGDLSPWNTTIDPERNGFVLTNPQYFFLPSWFNRGRSDYHSMQLSLRRRAGAHLFGVNYVLSQSKDNGSAAENGSLNSGTFWASTGTIPNALFPDAAYALSDFDLRHNFNAHWVVDLPFRASARSVDALVGGWSITGVWRWHSGFPLTADSDGGGLPAEIVGALDSSVTIDGVNGRPNLFEDPDTARTHLQYPRPDAVGTRNAVRGPSYLNVDVGVRKTVAAPWNPQHRVEFTAMAFNVFNTVNLSIRPPSYDTLFSLTATDNFGQITSAAGPRGGAREMEFGLRYSF
jgi:hypothetical protein